jgi:adenylate cyclase
MPSIQRKLAAILAADVYQFSKMMGEDETGTLANLRAARQIVDSIVAEHHGRIFGSAGDSVVAEFASAVSAMLCAVEWQRALAQRNAQAGVTPLQFRIGVNIGDVIVEGDNLYGDGINVAARLEAVAQPGAICVSAKVYDEVRRKLSDISFVDGGAQKLKNIEDPVAIYHVGGAGAAAAPAPSAPAPSAPPSDKPTVAVQPIRVISGDDEVRALAEGLTDEIGGSMARHTAVALVGADRPGVDFQLKGSVQSAGKRLRLSFGLVEGASGTQIWSQRYDRQLDDVFGLQDEIVLSVSAAIRVNVKTRLFERLRNADNGTLATPQLLDKAAGFFIRSLDHGGEAVRVMRLAVERAPDHAMASAMLGFSLFRVADYEATAIRPEVRDEIVAALDRAVGLDPRSYFGRTIRALALQDLVGDLPAARQQASEALQHNANFVAGQAMLGIAEMHLGDVAGGLKRLRDAMTASPEDASHHRHCRELAIGYLLAGQPAEGVRVATELCRDKPEMKRNALVLAGLLAAAGDSEGARRQVAAAKEATPGLGLETARLPRFGDASAGERFVTLLRESGL